MIHVCIPVLNSYETLEKCVETINNSSIKVDSINIIDNGGFIDNSIYSKYDNVFIVSPGYNLGVAASWNWFIDNVPGIRLICNDDVFFFEHAIEDLINGYDEDNLVFPLTVDNLNAFSCFILPDKIINEVGLFDEAISPNYGYFEDNDYYRRMRLANFNIKGVETQVGHRGSSTLKNFSPVEEEAHHQRFRKARDNYIKKWGGEPGNERFVVPYNKV